MIYLQVTVLIACLVVGILFGVSNQQPAVLSFFGLATKAVPLYLLLVATFLAGAVLAFFYNIISGSDSRTHMNLTQDRIRECEKTIKEQLTQIEAMRTERANRNEERKSAGQTSSELAEKA
jgi:uncharacterized integral membrane protein